MDKAINVFRSYLFSKFFECVYSCIAFAMSGSMLLAALVGPHIGGSDENASDRIFLLFCVVSTIISVIYSFWWHHKEQTGKFNSAIRHAWLRGIMRYFIAFDVSIYGFGKIFKTQFGISPSRGDVPVSSLSGFELTWNYFSYSYTFAVILGLLQIGSALLLLFRRTSLAGVFVLLPVMINIAFINVFYSIALGALVNCLIITVGLIYLLLLRWDDLKILFFADRTDLPKINSIFFKSIAKIITIGAAFGIIYSYVATQKQPYFTGKWSVTEITRNGQPTKPGEWLTNAMIWSNIYFEQTGKVILSANPYVYENARANNADYSYDVKARKLTLSYPGFSEKSDTVVVTVSKYDGKNMQWNLVHNRDTLRYEFSKAATYR